MNNEHKLIIRLALFLMASSISAQTTQLTVATISAGAARLDNGSLVNIGQPIVGLMSVPGGITVNAGLTPALQSGTNAVARPTLNSAPSFSGGHLQLTLFSQPGIRYALEASTNLMTWVSLSTNTATGATLVLQDPNTALFRYRFYRARVE